MAICFFGIEDEFMSMRVRKYAIRSSENQMAWKTPATEGMPE